MLPMSTPAESLTSTADNPWDGLRPQNVVQAAREDIKRSARNEARAEPDYYWAEGEVYEQYAFLKEHVHDADGAFGIIQRAIDAILEDRENPKEMFTKDVIKRGVKSTVWVDPSLAGRLRRSTKPHMIHLYNETLLRAALEMEKSDG